MGTKIESSYKLSGQVFRVNTSTDVVNALTIDGNLGKVSDDYEEIYMKTTGRSLAGMWKILLHEIGHIIVINSGLNHTILKDDDEQECVVECFASGMLDFMVGNAIIDVSEEEEE
jgi:hypothetical protein